MLNNLVRLAISNISKPRYASKDDPTSTLGILPPVSSLEIDRTPDAIPARPIKGHTMLLENIIEAADTARNGRRWAEAAMEYNAAVADYPERDDLRIQAGNCLKENGDYSGALRHYAAVRDILQLEEAVLQSGHLLKITNNFNAADYCYSWCASRNNKIALKELSEKSEWHNSVKPSFKDGVSTKHGDRTLSNLLNVVELDPLNCNILAALADHLAFSGRHDASRFYANLCILVAGTGGQRRTWLRSTFIDSGLWSDTYTFLANSKPAPLNGQQALLSFLHHTLPDWDADGEITNDEIKPEVAFPLTYIAEIRDNSAQVCALSNMTATLDAVVRTAFSLDACCDQGEVIAFVEKIMAAMRGLPNASTHAVSFGVASPDILDYRIKKVASTSYYHVCQRLVQAHVRHGHCLPLVLSIPTCFASVATASPHDSLSFDPLSIQHSSLDIETVNRLHDAAVLTGMRSTLSKESEWQSLQRLGSGGRGQRAINSWAKRVLLDRNGDIDRVLSLASQLKFGGAWRMSRSLLLAVAGLRPSDIGLQFELGILSKTIGDYQDAASRFVSALEVNKNNRDAGRELGAVARECMDSDQIAHLANLYPAFNAEVRLQALLPSPISHREASSADIGAEIANIQLEPVVDFGDECFDVIQIGWLKTTNGHLTIPRLIGISAVRVKIITSQRVVALRVRVAGQTVDRVGPSCAGVDHLGKRMYYANSWIDVSNIERGYNRLQVYVEFSDSGYMSRDFDVVIDDMGDDQGMADSDALVLSPPSNERADAFAMVAGLPTMIRPSLRRAFQHKVHRVLLMRLDQMGDVATSLFAMKRLKDCFPDSQFDVLVTPSNEAMVSGTGLFDNVITVAFPYDHGSRRRKLNKAGELKLKQAFSESIVDVAIDLSPGEDSRPILKLINARYRMGFKPHKFPFLDFGIDVHTRDAVNRREMISHTAMVNALAEAIAAAVAPAPARLLPSLDGKGQIAELGLHSKGYVVLHAGARLQIKRWPIENFVTLAKAIRKEFDLPVFLFSDDRIQAEQRKTLEEEPQITLKEGAMPFELFDAIISNAAIFVGNDTGPKHLAAVRGVFTISIHMDQVNWNEWGQDGEGIILSRRIPCCGCGIEDPSECGKDLACLTQIKSEDVMQAIRSKLVMKEMAGPVSMSRDEERQVRCP